VADIHKIYIPFCDTVAIPQRTKREGEMMGTMRMKPQPDPIPTSHTVGVNHPELTEQQALVRALQVLSKESLRRLREMSKEGLQMQFDWLRELEKRRHRDETKKPHGRRAKKNK
jgi:hypothetical protein